jgi:hypothetical protein
MLLLALLPAMAAAQQAQTRRALEADARAAARPLPAATSPLGLDEVLAASRFHAPQVLEALARVRGAEARVTTTEGAFDTLFNANVEARPTGFYDGAETGFRITQPFANNGGNFYGGYDVSRGSFSSSQSSNNTAQAGRITVGTMFALLVALKVVAMVPQVRVALKVVAMVAQAWVTAGVTARSLKLLPRFLV